MPHLPFCTMQLHHICPFTHKLSMCLNYISHDTQQSLQILLAAALPSFVLSTCPRFTMSQTQLPSLPLTYTFLPQRTHISEDTLMAQFMDILSYNRHYSFPEPLLESHHVPINLSIRPNCEKGSTEKSPLL